MHNKRMASPKSPAYQVMFENVNKPAVNIVSDNSRPIPRDRQLPMILSISMEMLRNAKNNDWESVIALESQRTAIIAEFFTCPVSAEETQAVARYINQVLEVDKQLIELGNQEREQLRENIQKVTHGKHALKVYSAV